MLIDKASFGLQKRILTNFNEFARLLRDLGCGCVILVVGATSALKKVG